MSSRSDCPFCRRIKAGAANIRHGEAVAFDDGFPLCRGHTLVVPVRHESSFFALTAAERRDICELVERIRAHLLDTLRADGFNIGLNDGEAAGQTVEHAHVHVIPRYAGDVRDPRGGVRWVLPERAKYWTE